VQRAHPPFLRSEHTWDLGQAPFVHTLGVDLAIGLSALSALLLSRRASGEAAVEVGSIVLAAVAVTAAGAPFVARSIREIRQGILPREALAGVAALACFVAGALGPVLVHASSSGWLAAMGVQAAAWQAVRGAGFEGAAAIAVALLIGHAAEDALIQRALAGIGAREEVRARHRAYGGTDPGDPTAAADAEVLPVLASLARARRAPAPGTWEEAAVRGLFTAALGCTSFAAVTHGCLGCGPIAPLPVFSAAAVLVVVSPASILAAAPVARTIAILRARAAGAVVREPRALEALARVDTACFQEGALGIPAARAAIDALRARGVRSLVLHDRPGASATGLRDLQGAGARVLLVGEGLDPEVAAQADAAVVIGPPGAAAPIVVPPARLAEIAALIDLGRTLRHVVRGGAVLCLFANAVLLPAAALGYLDPLRSAGLALAETLIGLAGAARLFRR
jgi:cation transport ATPase